MIHLSPPEAFAAKFEVVTCYVQYDGKFLMLLRNDEKDEGNKWCTPGGKVDKGETQGDAVIREIYEETGIALQPEQLVFFNTVYVRYPNYDFVFHTYSADVAELPQLTVSAGEHKDALWTTPHEALGMRLVMGNDILVRMFYSL